MTRSAERREGRFGASVPSASSCRPQYVPPQWAVSKSIFSPTISQKGMVLAKVPLADCFSGSNGCGYAALSCSDPCAIKSTFVDGVTLGPVPKKQGVETGVHEQSGDAVETTLQRSFDSQTNEP